MKFTSILLVSAAILVVVSGSPTKDKDSKGKGGKGGKKGVSTTPVPHLNATTLAPLNATKAPALNGSTEAPALNGTTVAPSLNETSTADPSLNGTTVASNTTTDASGLNGTTTTASPDSTTTAAPKRRFRRDCKAADLTTAEPKIISFLEAEFEKFFNGSSAAANATGAANGGSLVGQKVQSTANLENGTAIGHATAKRDTVQDVKVAGGTAIGNAESKKPTDNVLQTVASKGNETGVANALIDHSGSSAGGNAIQGVAASGDKAAATATINKDGPGNFLQNALASGNMFSLASSTLNSGAGAPAPGAPGAPAAGCAPQLKMDDSLRSFIKSTVAQAMENLKKDLAL